MASIGDSIRDVQREELKHRRWALYSIVIIIVVLSVWIGMPPEAQVQTGNATSVSYEIPKYYSPDVLISGIKTLPASCDTRENDTIRCLEPLAQTFFVQNLTANASYYVQAVHMRLKNTGNDTSGIIPFFAGVTSRCAYTGAPFNLRAGETSARIDFLCANQEKPDNVNGAWRAGYNSDRQSFGLFRTSGF